MKIKEIIDEVKECRIGMNRAWIYTEDGELADNILVCDIIPLLEELIPYEVEMTDDEINNILEMNDGYNTYNWGCNITNDINYYIDKTNNKCVMRIHLCGDVRYNYTDWFVIDMDNYDNFIEFLNYNGEFDYVIRKDMCINDRYVADVEMFNNTYNVYDYVKNEDIGCFYELEFSDLLKELKNLE